jgi:hypothetical protein
MTNILGECASLEALLFDKARLGLAVRAVSP